MDVELFDAMLDPIVVYERDGTIVYVNPAAATIAGRAVGDLVGDHVGSLFPTAEPELFGDVFRRVAASGRCETLDQFYPRIGRWFASRCYLSRGRIVMFSRDVTQDRLAAARLEVLAEATQAFARASRSFDRLLESITQSMATLVGDGALVTLLGPDGTTLVSAATAHRDPAIAAHYREFVERSPITKHTEAAVAAIVIRTGQSRLVPTIDPIEMANWVDPSLRPIVLRLTVHSFVVVPIHASGGRVIGSLSLLRSRPGMAYGATDVSLLEDLADRAGLALETAQLYAELEQRVAARTADLEAANLELEHRATALARASLEKSQFLSNLSHELRTPLNAIIGFSEMLHDDVIPRTSADALDSLADILASARHLLGLVNTILDLAKVEAGKLEFAPEPLSLTSVVGEVLAVLQPAIHKQHIAVEVACSPEIDQVVLDSQRLKQVLFNYLSNAIKFTPVGGRIDVRTTPHAQNMFAIEVADNGPGIAEADVSLLFQEFGQTAEGKAKTGTGLGLALTRRLVEAQGGQVGVTTILGHGATFFATLPRAYAA